MLTAKQERFCQLYAADRNGVAAYRGAYSVRSDTKDATCENGASKLLRDPRIVARIDALADAAAVAPGGALYDAAWCRERWAMIAQADPRELIGLRVGCCRYCWGAGHSYHWREREYLEALDKAERAAKRDPDHPLPDPSGGLDFNATRDPNPDCPECHGEGVERVVPRDTSKLSAQALLLYGGVKAKRDGTEIIIADRTKALENVTRMAGGYKDNVRLDGSISGMLAVAKIETTDPVEASRMYQELMASPAVRT
jgi:phage terminase small subunit